MVTPSLIGTVGRLLDSYRYLSSRPGDCRHDVGTHRYSGPVHRLIRITV